MTGDINKHKDNKHPTQGTKTSRCRYVVQVTETNFRIEIDKIQKYQTHSCWLAG